MKILSFDVGIKNLAYCIINSDNVIIEDWGILNISCDPKCNHTLKNDKICDKTAKKCTDDNIFLCSSHCKLKKYNEIKLKNVPKIKNPMLSLGKNIVKELNSKKPFLDVDIVCIENQPALKNPTMKSVQMIIYSYFLINGVCSDKSIYDIQMINARNKLKVYNGPKIDCDIKDKYKKNKYLAVQYCEYMINNNKYIDDKFIKLYSESVKKDDLSDCYLQGIYFFMNNKII